MSRLHSIDLIVIGERHAKLRELYKLEIVATLGSLGIPARHIGDDEVESRITDGILDRIATSQYIIAECTEANRNVYFEIGYALGMGRNVILLIESADLIPFDLKDFPFLVHNGLIGTLQAKLERRMHHLMETSRNPTVS